MFSQTQLENVQQQIVGAVRQEPHWQQQTCDEGMHTRSWTCSGPEPSAFLCAVHGLKASAQAQQLCLLGWMHIPADVG